MNVVLFDHTSLFLISPTISTIGYEKPKKENQSLNIDLATSF